MAVRQLCWPPGILFYCCSLDLSFFLPPHLWGRLADHQETLPHVQWWPEIYKIRSEIWVAPSFPQNLAAQNHENFGAISVNFVTCKYLRNTTSHRQSEDGVANYELSSTGKPNLVYLGPQMVKYRTRVLTHPTGGHQAGHCHASRFYLFRFNEF